MLKKFASIGQPDLFGYVYEFGAWDSNAQIHAHFRMFQTYGDGLTQHSGTRWNDGTEWGNIFSHPARGERVLER